MRGVLIRGFSLLELLVTISIVALLATLALPAIAGVKRKASKLKCISNLRQLQSCWQMYSDDSQGAVPPNRSVLTNGVWRSTADSWIGDSSAPYDVSTDAIRRGLLFKYDYNRSVELYRCPSDRSVTIGATRVRRTRSYSMNGNLGGRTNEVQETILNVSEIIEPANLFVLVDEQEDSIDDAHFLVWPSPDDRWVNMPADRHEQAGVFSFSDGHVEQWHWRHPKDFAKKESYWKKAGNGADLLDLRRLQAATLARANYIRQQ